MYKTILISTDGSDLASHGVEHGVALARQLGSRVVLVTVTQPWTVESAALEVGEAAYEATVEAQAQSVLEQAKANVDLTGVEVETVHVSNGFAAEAIVRTATETGADLIVMASHGRRGLRRALLGSQTSEVLTLSTIPVLVVR